MFSWIKRRQIKESAVQAIISMQTLGQAIWTPRKYRQLSEEGYVKNVIAYRCINEIAGASSHVKWLLHKHDASGNKAKILQHEVLDLLSRPNPQQSGASWLERVMAFHEISGNTYIEAVHGSDKPRELYCLRPDRMKVVAGSSGPAAYEYSVGSEKKVWEVDPLTEQADILHIKTFHPLNDWYGMSRLEAAAFEIDIHNQTLSWNKSLLDNGARPSGALVYGPKDAPQNLDDEQYMRLKKQIDEQYSGSKNAGRPMLLEGGMDWKEMGLSPKDMDYILAKDTSARDIALAFGVPPMILGIPGDNTYSNMKEARQALWEQTVLPLLYKIAGELNNWLLPKFEEGIMLGIDEDNIPALAPRREAMWNRLENADFLTVNEKREAVGYGPMDNGDEILVPANMLPLGFDATQDTQKSLEKWLVEENGYSEDKAKEMAGLAFCDNENG